MSNRIIAFLAVLALIVAILTGIIYVKNRQLSSKQAGFSITTNGSSISNSNTSFSYNEHTYANDIIKPRKGQPVKKFTLLAQESNLRISSDVTIPVWTYNGTVPGSEIRVNQGDFVEVTLRNSLKEPVTIHWHGYPLNSAMDGIPGITQDAVRAGESFTYKFSADVPGTYWYHSHQQSSMQVDKGLYGALIVEPKDVKKPDKDFTLIIDEWMSDPNNAMDMSSSSSDMSNMDMSGSSNSNMEEMNMGNSEPTDPVLSEEEMMAYAYDLYTINGKSGDLIKPLSVKVGDKVKLRLINAGYRSHGMHISGQNIKIVSTDGQDIEGAGTIKDNIIMIAPGERYDVEFTVTSENNFTIDAHDENAYNDQLIIPVEVAGGNGKMYTEPDEPDYPIFDLSVYGAKSSKGFTQNQKFDQEYVLLLNTRVDNGKLSYTINDKTYDVAPAISVKTGDTVKLTLTNKSKVNHPMHLHGHFFQLLSKNGKLFEQATIMKDTLNVKPGESYVVAFKADNPGNWANHCHELHHAAAGMMNTIIYTDYTSNYEKPANDTTNKAE